MLDDLRGNISPEQPEPQPSHHTPHPLTPRRRHNRQNRGITTPFTHTLTFPIHPAAHAHTSISTEIRNFSPRIPALHTPHSAKQYHQFYPRRKPFASQSGRPTFLAQAEFAPCPMFESYVTTGALDT